MRKSFNLARKTVRLNQIQQLIQDYINFGISKKAWWERNQLILLLSKRYPSHLTQHVGNKGSRKLLTVVCVHIEKVTATWHISDDQLHYFSHLSYDENHWDGHTTEEKYMMLREL